MTGAAPPGLALSDATNAARAFGIVRFVVTYGEFETATPLGRQARLSSSRPSNRAVFEPSENRRGGSRRQGRVDDDPLQVVVGPENRMLNASPDPVLRFRGRARSRRAYSPGPPGFRSAAGGRAFNLFLPPRGMLESTSFPMSKIEGDRPVHPAPG